MTIAGAMASAAAVAGLSLAPAAVADTQITAQQLCDRQAPGTVVVISLEPGVGQCISPGDTPLPQVLNPNQKWLRPGPGLTKVNPNDPLSDWIVADQPPPPAADIACDQINGSIVCGPQIVRPCSGPGAPCGW
jgi:hypothetical protein